MINAPWKCGCVRQVARKSKKEKKKIQNRYKYNGKRREIFESFVCGIEYNENQIKELALFAVIRLDLYWLSNSETCNECKVCESINFFDSIFRDYFNMRSTSQCSPSHKKKNVFLKKRIHFALQMIFFFSFDLVRSKTCRKWTELQVHTFSKQNIWLVWMMAKHIDSIKHFGTSLFTIAKLFWVN